MRVVICNDRNGINQNNGITLVRPFEPLWFASGYILNFDLEMSQESKLRDEVANTLVLAESNFVTSNEITNNRYLFK